MPPGSSGCTCAGRSAPRSRSRPRCRCPIFCSVISPRPRRNTRYVGDITYLPVGDGQFVYLATVLDLCSKRLVGWSIATHMRTELVTDALKAAAAIRDGRLDGAVFHSDHGAQYVARDFAQVREELDVVRSRGAVGTSADNAAAESFNASLKRDPAGAKELVRGTRGPPCGLPVGHHNTRRRHSSIGQISPITYEQRSNTLCPMSKAAMPGLQH